MRRMKTFLTILVSFFAWQFSISVLLGCQSRLSSDGRKDSATNTATGKTELVIVTEDVNNGIKPLSETSLKAGEWVTLKLATYLDNKLLGLVDAVWLIDGALFPKSDLIMSGTQSKEAIFRPTCNGDAKIIAVAADSALDVADKIVKSPVIKVTGYDVSGKAAGDALTMKFVMSQADGSLVSLTETMLQAGQFIGLKTALYKSDDTFVRLVDAYWSVEGTVFPKADLVGLSPNSEVAFMPTRDGDAVIIAVVADSSQPVIEKLIRSPAITVSGFADANITPIATISGLPASISNATSLTLEIKGVDSFCYKIVQGSTACAEDPVAYSDWLESADPIKIESLGSDGVKRLCVIGAKNGIVQGTATSYSWTLDSTPPGAYSITSPAANVNAQGVTLQWQSAAGAVKYDVTLASDLVCSVALSSEIGTTATSFAVTGLAAGQYYVCVRAYDSLSNAASAANDGYSFKVDLTAPQAPTAPTPPGTYVSTSTVALTWSAVTDDGLSGVASYRLRIGTTPSSDNTFDQNVGNVTSYTLTSLAEGGPYYASVQAIDGASNASAYSADGTAFTVDRTNPVAPTTLVTAATSGGLDSRFATGTNVYLSWSGASDVQSGIASYAVKYYDQANCAGNETVISDLIGASYEFNGATGTTYSFKVIVTDKTGKTATSSCSKPIKIGIAPPAALTAFTAVTGLKTGEIAITVDFPVSPSYQTVEIRRIAGITAPSDLCNDGTVVKTYTSFADETLYDATGSLAGDTYSYRVCITGTNGEVRSTDKAENVAAKLIRHTIFTTSMPYNGGLGGIAGADNICTTHAQNAGIVANKYRAVLSTETTAVRNRLLLLGPVYNIKNQRVANNAVDLWDGTIGYPVSYDEFGASVASSLHTGSQANGSITVNGTCTNWTVTSGQSFYAFAGSTNSYWMYVAGPNNVYCNTPLPFMCITQEDDPPPLSSFTAVTGTLTGEVTVSLTVPADLTHYGKIEIRRISSDIELLDTCVNGSVIKQYLRGGIISDSFTDATGVTNTWLNYRVCAYDLESNLISTIAVTNVKPKDLVAYRILVTSTIYDGNLGGRSGADAKCQERAVAASLGGTWVALLATSTKDVVETVTTNGPFFNLRAKGNQQIATNKSDLMDQTLAAPPAYTEFGQYSSIIVRTGSQPDGHVYPGQTCSDHTSTSGNILAYGGSAYTTSGWLHATYNGSCSVRYAIYCIEQ